MRYFNIIIEILPENIVIAKSVNIVAKNTTLKDSH
jgi:hypothetical protein